MTRRAGRSQGGSSRSVIVGGCAALCFGLATPARASENIQLFRFDSGLSVPRGPDLGTWGVGVSLEPKFHILDAVVVGIRLDGAAHMGGSISNSSVSVSQWASTAMLAKGEYYLFPLNSVRPFAGLGLGVYNMGGQNIGANSGGASVSQQAGRYFGVAPQIGVELGRLRLSVMYNAILGADLEVKQQASAGQAPPPPVEMSRNFIAFELGVRFGGGRKAATTPAPVAAVPGGGPTR